MIEMYVNITIFTSKGRFICEIKGFRYYADFNSCVGKVDSVKLDRTYEGEKHFPAGEICSALF